MRYLTILPLVALLACGGSDPAEAPAEAHADHAAKTETKKPEAEKPAAPAKEEAPSVVTDDGTTATVALEGTDAMQYNTKVIKVAAGRKVKLTLTHTGKIPASAMGHNFVLLKAGTDINAFATKSMNAKDTDYIAAEVADQVIANTKVVGGGESVTIEFDAPEAGTYPFLCSFPGHSAMMKGEFIVE